MTVKSLYLISDRKNSLSKEKIRSLSLTTDNNEYPVLAFQLRKEDRYIKVFTMYGFRDVILTELWRISI